MIYVHTFKVIANGEEDYCQFFEYNPNPDMCVIDSEDIPIALLFPQKHYTRGYMRNLVKHYSGEASHVTYHGTVAFENYDFVIE